jgi:hypothetical protein
MASSRNKNNINRVPQKNTLFSEEKQRIINQNVRLEVNLLGHRNLFNCPREIVTFMILETKSKLHINEDQTVPK